MEQYKTMNADTKTQSTAGDTLEQDLQEAELAFWLVVRFRGPATEIVGLYTDRAAAVAQCKHGAYVMGEILTNQTYTPEAPWRGTKAT